MADKNLVLDIVWNNEPIPVEEKLADQSRIIEIPIGVMLNLGQGGGGTVKSVNNVLPNGFGNISLTYQDVDAEKAGAAQAVQDYIITNLTITFEDIYAQIQQLREDTTQNFSNISDQFVYTKIELRNDFNPKIVAVQQDLDNTKNVVANHDLTIADLSNNKLNRSEYRQLFLGVFTSMSSLVTAHPTAEAGSSADIDTIGFDVLRAIWDSTDNKWVVRDANNATNTDAVPEGQSNLYFTVQRVLNAVLDGLVTTDASDVLPTDKIVVAMGKFQAKFKNITATIRNTVLSGIGFTDSTDVTNADSIEKAVGKFQAKFNNFANYVRGTALTGIDVTATTTKVSATDTVLSGHGKLQGQITDFLNKLPASVRNTVLSGVVFTDSSDVTNADTVEVSIGKLATKIKNGSGGGTPTPAQTWVDTKTLAGFMMHAGIDQTKSKLEISKYQGQIYIRGYLWCQTNTGGGVKVFAITAPAYMVDVSFTRSGITGSVLARIFMGNSSVGSITGTVQQAISFGDELNILNEFNLSAGAVYHIPATCLGVAKVP